MRVVTVRAGGQSAIRKTLLPALTNDPYRLEGLGPMTDRQINDVDTGRKGEPIDWHARLIETLEMAAKLSCGQYGENGYELKQRLDWTHEYITAELTAARPAARG